MSKFSSWIRRVRRKYFDSPDDLKTGLADCLIIFDYVEAHLPSKARPFTGRARKIVRQLQVATEIWDVLDDDK